ncbi:hypothetical protein B0T26DRAFT_705207 [Lasiosphaeria miniovina]|uniref:Uncharacterized protein n=1 Tax=Lasiosphaeria miniovina TaxID=1954250 RepID=A0AA40E069_9PEZI|nr:uncharacterized protein B0T26DRAFT_705207 [Lasiosphaeria miniovina]KAK0723064.1 hypothetical protein B0T26DRAFT_705207 [Lasiosphaeria miniovina]
MGHVDSYSMHWRLHLRPFSYIRSHSHVSISSLFHKASCHIWRKQLADRYLIPSVGDLGDLWMAYKLITKAGGLVDGLPWELRGMMVANVVFDFAISFFPVLGAFAGAVCRANTRNAWLVDSYLRFLRCSSEL